MNPLFIITSLLFGIHFAFAQTPRPGCVEVAPLSGNMQAQVLQTSKGCEVMLSPSAQATNLRRYTFSQRGVIEIFNQYSDNTNGSRAYFVFPHAQIPALMVVNHEEMDVVTSAGDKIKFDTKANPPHLESQTAANFRMIENPVISKDNEGGVEIVLNENSRTLVLDSGFLMGGAAFTIPTRTSTFHDALGNECTLQNSKLFNFANYDADLKYDDTELWVFLKTACPDLRLPN